jgi:hypothetical protein
MGAFIGVPSAPRWGWGDCERRYLDQGEIEATSKTCIAEWFIWVDDYNTLGQYERLSWVPYLLQHQTMNEGEEIAEGE